MIPIVVAITTTISVMSNDPAGSLVVTAVIFAQVSCGLAILSFTVSPHYLGNVATFGLALAIGAAVFTVVDQVVLATLGSSPTAIFWVFGLGSFVVVMLRSAKSPLSADDDLFEATMCFLAMFLGLSASNPAAIVASAFLIAMYLMARRLRIQLSWTSMLVPLGMIVSTFYLGQRFFNGAQPFWWGLNRGSDDQIYSESLSWAISTHGPFSNPLANGVELNYHWFSLAWAGLTSRLGGLDPFFVTLHVVGPVGLIGTAAIIVAILRHLKVGRIGIAIAIVVAFASSTFPEPTRLVYVLNTSNVASHLWFALTIWLIVRYLDVPNFTRGSAVVFATVVTFLAKIPYGVSLLTGLGLVGIVAITSRQHIRQHVSVAIAATATTAMAYIVFISPPAWRAAGFRLGNSLGGLVEQGDQLTKLLTVIMALVVIHAWLIVPLLSGIRGLRHGPSIEVFLVGAAAAGLLRFLLDGATSENYFLSAAVVPVALLAATREGDVRDAFTYRHRRRTLAQLTTIGIGSFLILVIMNRQFDSQTNQVKLVVLSSFASVAILIFAIRSVRQSNSKWFTQLFLGVVALGVAQFMGSLVSSDHSRLSHDRQYVTTAQIQGLTWLREHATRDDVIATNISLCRDGQECLVETGRSIVSAFSRHMAFVEGPRSIVGAGPNPAGGRPFPEWLEERIALALNASEDLNAVDLEKLRCSDVDYIVISPITHTNDTTSPPWLTSVYANSEISIFELASKNGHLDCSAE